MWNYIRDHVASVAAVLGVLGVAATGIYKFSNLETRVDMLERQNTLLTSSKGARGDLCAQIMTTHLQGIVAGNSEQAAITSLELERFGCDEFASLASTPAIDRKGVALDPDSESGEPVDMDDFLQDSPAVD